MYKNVDEVTNLFNHVILLKLNLSMSTAKNTRFREIDRTLILPLAFFLEEGIPCLLSVSELLVVDLVLFLGFDDLQELGTAGAGSIFSKFNCTIKAGSSPKSQNSTS